VVTSEAAMARDYTGQ